MPLPDFSEHLSRVVARVRQHRQETKAEEVAAKKERKQQDQLTKTNLDKARRDTLVKLDQIGLLPALFSIESGVLGIYGEPPSNSFSPPFIDRVVRRFFPFSTDNNYINGEEIRVLYRQVDAGKMSPDTGNPRQYTVEQVPKFSLAAVCKYSPSGAFLVISEGRYAGVSTEGNASFTDPRVKNQSVTALPFTPVEDWSRTRVSERIGSIFSSRPELKGYFAGDDIL